MREALSIEKILNMVRLVAEGREGLDGWDWRLEEIRMLKEHDQK